VRGCEKIRHGFSISLSAGEKRFLTPFLLQTVACNLILDFVRGTLMAWKRWPLKMPPGACQSSLIAPISQAQQKKPGGEVANPHAGFLNINLVSSLREALGCQLSAIS